VIALDRMEKGNSELSAIQEVEKEFDIPVKSIITLNDIIDYLAQSNTASSQQYLNAMKTYRAKYGIS